MANQFASWSTNEDAELAQMWAADVLTIEEIADAMGRGTSTVKRRISALRLPKRGQRGGRRVA